MPRRLPPLSALRLFEAAGRHLSFKLAAAELHLTPSAVSHGITGLERALQVTLFTRGPRGLALTPAGAEYLGEVGAALERIALATQRLPGSRGGGIAVSCAPTFAARWLLPRLPEFSRHWPRTAVTVDTSQRQVGFPADGFDFAIRMGHAPTAGLDCTRLFGERLLPVCSPAYRAGRLDARGRFRLRGATLIHITPASEDWRAWAEARGLGDLDLDGGLRFDTIQMAFDAASAGLGVVLGRQPLVDRELDSGALVALEQEALTARTAYWLLSGEAPGRSPELGAFRDWLVEASRPLRAGAAGAAVYEAV